MKCDKCNEIINTGEEREWHGQHLCEDCYMDVLSPARACAPWAVHSAKSFLKHGGNPELSENQKKILEILEETNGAEPGSIAEKLRLRQTDFERELAALRHMEKIRAQLRNGKKIICLWDADDN